jgi:hypothetical protein
MILIRYVYFVFFPIILAGCEKSEPARPPSLPENVMEDRPIIIKEGQALILVPDGKESLMLAVTVSDGDLLISEVDPDGKSLSVTWHDEESWTTSVMDTKEGQTTTVIDKNGDGIPDIRAVLGNGSLSRFRLEEAKWIDQK